MSVDANASPTHKYDKRTDTFKLVKWKDLAVGDLIQIKSRETLPADVLALGVAENSRSHQNGVCYVETKSLDGETNLKLKSALSSTYPQITTASIKDFVSSLDGVIEMEHPNNLIETFSGICDLDVYGRESIQPKHVLLRGCVLRNTEFVIGLVVNTGHDTKIMMSSSGTPSKTSTLETRATNQIRRIIFLLILVCFAGATGQAIWDNDMKVKIQDHWYLRWDPDEGAVWINQFFYYFLLHATFIPVSLYVSMSAVRFFQSKFMNLDLDMYHEPTDTPALVRTMTLNEELGQISHIFTDKTGTLTCNIMDFRKASIGGESYGEGITDIGRVAWSLQGIEIPEKVLHYEKLAKQNSTPHVSFYCPKYDRMMKTDSVAKRKACFFYKVLATCHDIIPEHIGEDIVLSASNPDDEATVAAAKYFGYEFSDRKEKTMVIKNHETGEVEKMELLETIEFSSERKRMTVIVRDLATSEIIVMTKGADSVILERLVSQVSPTSQHLAITKKKAFKSLTSLSLFKDQDNILRNTVDHLNEFAVEGLRCLLVSCKILGEKEFSSWHERYKIASTSLLQINLQKKGDKNDIDELQDEIESNLMLIGGTAIEDRLQDGVPDCIDKLAAAGIKMWMLTGDKEETAINIAIACNLLRPKEFMKHIIVNKYTCPNESNTTRLFEQEITEFDIEVNAGKHYPRALVIDGPALVKVMANKANRVLLLELGKRCKAVVGCRVSPEQKKEMTSLIKNGIEGVRTLAIGDGANDVAMIQAAHVGVGIKGAEGLQAVNSADFAISQFRYLAPLLLKHGRSNYIRLSSLVIYMFYKNLFMSICQFWFTFYNGFSGQKYYTEGGIQLFNVVFTSIPILILGAFDADISYLTVSSYPQIYQDCVRNLYFGNMRFWFWLFNGLLESIMCATLPLYLLQTFDADNGTSASLWESGACCFTAVVIVCTLKILLLQHCVTSYHVVVLLFSIASWAIVASLINSIISVDYNWYNVWFVVTKSLEFWMILLILIVSIMLKDSFVCIMERLYFTKNHQILQEMEVCRKKETKHLTTSSLTSSVRTSIDCDSNVTSHTRNSKSDAYKGSIISNSKGKGKKKSNRDTSSNVDRV